MDAMLVTGLLWMVVVAGRRLARDGAPALRDLYAGYDGRDERWPTGVQEENDERPWHRRVDPPERRPGSRSRHRPHAPQAMYVDLTDAGRHAPGWAVEGLTRPGLERVRADPIRAR